MKVPGTASAVLNKNEFLKQCPTTAHWFLLKLRFGEWAVIFQVSFRVSPSLGDLFPTPGLCCSLAIGMEHCRHPVAAWANGRWARRPRWGFMQPKVLQHIELKSRVAVTHQGWENTPPTYSSVSYSVGKGLTSCSCRPRSCIPEFTYLQRELGKKYLGYYIFNPFPRGS